jgi:hypothetical protein
MILNIALVDKVFKAFAPNINVTSKPSVR